MNGWKKQAEYLKRTLKKVKTWHLVVILIVFAILSVIFLRVNNLGMVELRDQVIAADKSGNQAALTQAASTLQKYVSRHMNTDTGQIPLQNSYDRAVQDAFDRANQDIDASGYSAATEECKRVIAAGGYQGYAECVAGTVGVGESTLNTPDLPNSSLYYLYFASPIVSFDLAGVMVILTTLVFCLIIIKLLTEVIIYFLLYRGQRR